MLDKRFAALLEAADAANKAKGYSDTYLFSKGDYGKDIFEFQMKAHRIDKSNASFDELRMDIKRQRTTTVLSKVLDSPNTILCIGETALPRAFKVFVSTDPKSGDKTSKKLFIDLTGLVKLDGGKYVYRSGDLAIIVAYLLAGMNAKIYAEQPVRVFNKTALVDAGAKCFSALIYYITDFLRVSSDPHFRSRVKYLSSIYFQVNIMGREYTESIENRARKIAQITEQEINVIDILTNGVEDPYKDINEFCKAIAALARKDDFTLDVFIGKWMHLIGAGTQFATELYPAFSNMLIYAYSGVYLNNQKTIERAVGRDMVDFVNQVIRLGNEVLK